MDTPNFPFSLKASDLDALKEALEVIIGSGVKPTHRLEIFARLAGYRSFAALKSALEALDVFGRPAQIPLEDNPRQNDPFLTSLPVETRRHLAHLHHTGVVRMVGVALAMGQHPVFGRIGVSTENLEAIVAMAKNTGIHTPITGLTPEDLPNIPPTESPYTPSTHHPLIKRPLALLDLAPLLVIASPANRLNLAQGLDDTPPTLDHPNRWYATPLHVQPVNQITSHNTIVFEADDFSWIERQAPQFPLAFFDDQDREAFAQALLARTGRRLLAHQYTIIKPLALAADCEHEGTLFSLGFYGCSLLEPASHPQEVDGPWVLRWMAGIIVNLWMLRQEYNRFANSKAEKPGTPAQSSTYL